MALRITPSKNPDIVRKWLALTGQTVAVNVYNVDAGSGHSVSGGIIADELNPYAMQKYMEYMLLGAAKMGFAGVPWGM